MSKGQGFVAVPNWVFDDVMPILKGNQWKVYSVILRKTLGFNKQVDAIPVKQFKDAGIKDKETILGIISDLEKGGFITVVRKNGCVNCYQILPNQSGKTIPVEAVGENLTSRVNPDVLVGENPTATSQEKPDSSTDNTKDNIQKTVIVTPSASKPAPKTKAEPKEKTSLEKLIERGCDEQLAKDFIAHRKTKKSAITDTALNLIASQATKAGIEFSKAVEICIARNWVSFNASWKWQDETPVAQYQVPTNFNAPEDTHVPVMTDYERDENGMPVFTPIDWSDVLAEVDGGRAS